MTKFSKSSVTKLRRTRSIEKCIEDGRTYLKNGKGKRILRDRTVIKTRAMDRPPIKPKVAVGLPPRRPTGVARRPTAASTMSPPIPAPIIRFPFGHPSPITPAMYFKASKSTPAVPFKSTTFKTSSKGDLPMPAFGFIDVCFCLDATGSMSSELAQAQSTITNLINRLSGKVRTEGVTLRFGVVAYHDHMDPKVLEILDFTDGDEAIRFVNKLTASGGGDEPEAAHDAILTACQKLTWMNIAHTPMLRYIFHVLDAPPHGKEFGTGQSQEGCTCGIKTDTILNAINLQQIHFRMIKVRNNPKVDIMEGLFKKRLGNFDSADIGNAREMDVKVSDMVIHEIMPDA